MPDQITSMRVFQSAALQGNFSLAAKTFDISPVMVAKHINALEKHLGVRLFFRTTRKLRLSEEGLSYLEACKQILSDIDAIESQVTAKQHVPNGTLKVNLPLSYGIRRIVPLMQGFRDLYPEVELELGLSDGQSDIVAEGWDLSIRIGQLKDSSFKSRKLHDCKIKLCASPQYLDAFSRPEKAEQLIQHNCLSYTLSSSQNRKFWHFGRKGEHKVPVKGIFHANNGDALLAAAIAGMGIIYQPDFIVDSAISQGLLSEIFLDYKNVDLGGIYLLYPNTRYPVAKTRVMIDYLVKHIQNPF